MIDKKTFVLAVIVSWVLTLVTVLLISNFVPSFTQSFTQQSVSLHNVKVVNLQKNEVFDMEDMSGLYARSLNFSWSPLNPNDNAILGIFLSFEGMSNSVIHDISFQYSVRINEFVGSDGRTIYSLNTGEWGQISYNIIPSRSAHPWMNPNQSEYSIKVGITTRTNQTVIRNVNLMLLVIDG